MSGNYKHDPVNAISEAEATGEVADIFSDIRKTMQLPLLTSIWRILAGVNDGLAPIWQYVKPVFESGQVDAALHKMLEAIKLPELSHINIREIGLDKPDLQQVKSIINTYNRSNGLNFLGLSAIDCKPGQVYIAYPVPTVNVQVTTLPALPDEKDLEISTGSFLYQLNKIGATPDEPGLATLWRHLAYWPDLLHIIHEELIPLQSKGTIDMCKQQMLSFASHEGERLAHHLQLKQDIPETAHGTVTKYVRHPGLVVRMVVIGHILASMFQKADI